MFVLLFTLYLQLSLKSLKMANNALQWNPTKMDTLGEVIAVIRFEATAHNYYYLEIPILIIWSIVAILGRKIHAFMQLVMIL